MRTLDIRPGLQINIHTGPASDQIQWWLPDSPIVIFNPRDASFRPYGEDCPLKEILASIAPADIERIKHRLLNHDEDRRKFYASANKSSKITLNPAYREAVFEFVAQGKPSDFWVITAYNPDGKSTDSILNKAADERLHEAIEALGHTSFRVIGKSPEDLPKDQHHAEPGWGIPCDEATALKLAKRFSQEAVFHFKDGGIWLVDCSSGARESLTTPSARIYDPCHKKHFTLFLGAPKGCKVIDDQTSAAIRSCIMARFENFTIQRAEGCYQNGREDTALVHIGTPDYKSVISLAHELRVLFQQDGVGISHNGIYQRARETSDESLILESFGLSEQK
ncbi:MAG: hypothetical protein RLZZ505_2997 [Verrucomicrobiota bacterium]|jgi:hypothetical protein